jgi:hypothetical protein
MFLSGLVRAGGALPRGATDEGWNGPDRVGFGSEIDLGGVTRVDEFSPRRAGLDGAAEVVSVDMPCGLGSSCLGWASEFEGQPGDDSPGFEEVFERWAKFAVGPALACGDDDGGMLGTAEAMVAQPTGHRRGVAETAGDDGFGCYFRGDSRSVGRWQDEKVDRWWGQEVRG